MSDHTNFLNIVQNSEAVSARWADLTEKAIADAREHGITLEPDDVLEIREIRLAAMGAPLDSEAYEAELLNLPALSTAARKKQIQDGDPDARAAAISDLNRGKDDVRPEYRMADSAARLSRARELGIATPPAEQDARSRNERLEALKDISGPAMRVSLARKWGLIE